MKWQAVFFDFDGVILDSVNVKTKAFEKMFEPYGPEVQKKVVQYHLENGGVSRFDKFRYYYENILKSSIEELEIQKLSQEFSDLVVNEVIDSNFIEGAYETLEKLAQASIPAYVVSGTPHDEINLIVKRKKLDHFFIEVHGSPRKKWEISQDLLDRKGYDPLNCIFIGDSFSDYQAAQKTGMQFLGIVPEGSSSPFPKDTKVSDKVSTFD